MKIKQLAIIILAVLVIGGVFYFKDNWSNIRQNNQPDKNQDVEAWQDTAVESLEAGNGQLKEKVEKNKIIKIRIVKQPLGEEPDWVKQAWVGLEIPVDSQSYLFERGQEVLSKQNRQSKKYAAPVEVALRILKDKNPQAEAWWRKNVDLSGVEYIAFEQDVCELIQ